MKVTKDEQKYILQALLEYENNNYDSRDDKWQATVNNLITKIEEIK